MNANRKFYTDIDLSNRYSVSRQTIWAWVRAGQLPPPVKIGSRCSRWPGDELANYEAERAAAQKVRL